jgi:UDP-glucose 4-epimerase
MGAVTQLLPDGVLVTGAAGFVGRGLCVRLRDAGIRVHAVARQPLASLSRLGVRVFAVGDIASFGDWKAIFDGVTSVVHLAGRAHVLRESAANAGALYFHSNFDATKSVANAAIECGARQFIFMSTVKVFGDRRFPGPLHPSQPTDPTDDYGRSKLAAEHWLLSTGPAAGLEVAVVRPPLIYGPEVRANFLRLMGWVERGVPLPLARITNLRSLVSVWNLNDLLMHLIDRRGAAGGVWHVSDDEDCSTTRLVEEIAAHMSRDAKLFAVPHSLLRRVLSIAGRRSEYDRLFESLQLDVTETIARLAWHPRVSLHEGLARTVQWYLQRRRETDS